MRSLRLVFYVVLMLAVAVTVLASEPGAESGEYLVGVFYFPGWASSAHEVTTKWRSNWQDIAGLPGSTSPGHPWPERKPLLGYYPEEERWVADVHLQWMKQHGISFVVYDWYWNNRAGAPEGNHAIDNFLQSPQREGMRFSLIWDPHDKPLTLDNCRAAARYWAAHYLARPEILRLDGKPVIMLSEPARSFGPDLSGWDKNTTPRFTRELVDAIRQEVRGAGIPDVYLVAAVQPGEEKLAMRDGYDALTTYNNPYAGMRDPKAHTAPYHDVISGYQAMWKQFRRFGKLPYFPSVMAGWDDRAWHGPTVMYRGSNLKDFSAFLDAARKFVDANPRLTQHVVLIEAWNEFTEGSFVEPTQGIGFTYLDAIRKTFSGRKAAHQDVVPQHDNSPDHH